ncbi:DNA-binding transcriptional LysR family regulator [Kitasatospora sp. MAA4]|uniref:LysR family transcriptional regulator n=1 Tax=Kitasatospora sp. MAA4 TaxID=3035093 RepID=UPI0024768C92|nr:LysR family transcriptional regulator [Kitasatospora sp. MAA4]MDH6135618.1 DNA-binding transcriptional LysR family regulator [Kitasatospora sp. MAA4]
MTLDDLRVFVAACESGNLSAVARDLSRTQSAVSQHVKRLEAELGLTLLERQPRGVAPTQAGRILHQAAAQGIGHLDHALRQLRDLKQGDTGTVRIATGAITVRHFMADAVVGFRRQHPNVTLEFRTENSSRRCFEALAANAADLAWVTIGAPARGIEQRPVMELPWVLAVRADDPLAARTSIEAADLAQIQLIQLPANSISRARLDEQLARDAIELASTTSVADWDTAILLAELGLGHAVVPALPGWSTAVPGPLRLIPIPMLAPLAAGWAVRQWDALSPLTREFADTVADSLRCSS